MERTIKEVRYFHLFPYCFLVKGVKRGAIYNTKTGDVFSINKTSTEAITLLEEGYSIRTVIKKLNLNIEQLLKYLQLLEEEGLGNSSEIEEVIPKVDLKQPEDKLRFLWLEITNSCNLRCVHCYISALNNRSSQEKCLSEIEFIQILKEGYSLGCTSVQFTGGEPFLENGRLMKLIKIARIIGYKFIEIYSNCTLIEPEIIPFLKINQVNMATSVYGYNNIIHDSITGVEGSFDKTITAIRLMTGFGIPVRVGIIKMEKNQSAITETINFLKNIGIKRIKVDSVRPAGRGQNLYKYSPNELKLNQLPITSKCNWEKFQKAHYGHNCFLDKLCVAANGTIIPCIMARNIVLGNICQKSLASILKDNLAKEIRSITKDKIEICMDCEFRYCCFDCRVKVKNFSKNNMYSKPIDCLYNPFTGKQEKPILFDKIK